MVNIPDQRLRRAAYDRFFNLGWSAVRIHRDVFTLSDGAQIYSLRHVQRLIKEFKVTFSPRPPSRSRRRPAKLRAEEVAWLKDIVDGDPSLYLDEIQHALREEHGCIVSCSTICRTIHKPVLLGGLGYSLQVLEVHARQRVYFERLEFLQRMRLWNFEPHMILNIDESSVGENHARRRRGWGQVGKKLLDMQGFGRGRNGTLLAACDVNGFVLPMCDFWEGNMDADRFCLWLEAMVAPGLGDFSKGEAHSVVVMDSCTLHKVAEVQQIVERTGALLLYNAKYSPDLVPVELGFNDLKVGLRRNSKKVKDQDLKNCGIFRNLLFSTLAYIPMRSHFKRCGLPVPAEQKEEDLKVAAVVAVVAAVAARKRQRHV